MMFSNNMDINSNENLPFNTKNELLTTNDLNNLLSSYGISKKFTDIKLYQKAFLHRSYCTRKNENFLNGNIECPENCLPLQEESNERLEFLGDSILNFVVANYLFDRYPDVNEGFLTKMRTKLVNGQMLASLSEKIGFGKYLLISAQIEIHNGRTNKNILEDIFEAFIGAIYLDFNECKINTKGKIPMLDGTGIGFQTVEKWIIYVIETFVDFSDLINSESNIKDKLVKYCQHTFQWIPKFYEIDISEKDNKKIHTVCIKDNNGCTIATAQGNSRKQAEHEASKKGLTYYGSVM